MFGSLRRKFGRVLVLSRVVGAGLGLGVASTVREREWRVNEAA